MKREDNGPFPGRRLGDVVKLNPRYFDAVPGAGDLVSFVPMAAVEEATGRLDATETRAWEEVSRGYTRFQDRDVLFAKITPCMENGKFALASNLHGGRGAGSTEFHVLRCSDHILPEYLLHYLLQRKVRADAQRLMKGAAGQLRVPESFLADLEIPLPAVGLQREVVNAVDALLTRLDAAVAALKRVQANLKRYRASVLKAACEGRLVTTEAELARAEGRDYEPASVLLERILKERRQKWEEAELLKMRAKGKEPTDDEWKRKYKEPEGPDREGLPQLPTGWCWASLPQIGELNRGKSRHRPRNDPRLLGGPYPFVQTGEVTAADTFIRHHEQTYTEAGLAQSRLWPSGTLCITIAANIAETVILTFDACFPDCVVGFRCPDYAVLVRFAEMFVSTARDSLARYAPATAQKNINIGILSRLAIPLPPLPEQDRIVDEVDRRHAVAAHMTQTAYSVLQRGSGLRHAVLNAAFAGHLTPTEPQPQGPEGDGVAGGWRPALGPALQ